MATDGLRLSDAASASVEYALVLFLVVVLAIGAIHLVGGTINSLPAILSDQVGVAQVPATTGGQHLGTSHRDVIDTQRLGGAATDPPRMQGVWGDSIGRSGSMR